MPMIGFANLVPEAAGDPKVGAPSCGVTAPSQLTVQ